MGELRVGTYNIGIYEQDYKQLCRNVMQDPEEDIRSLECQVADVLDQELDVICLQKVYKNGPAERPLIESLKEKG